MTYIHGRSHLIICSFWQDCCMPTLAHFSRHLFLVTRCSKCHPGSRTAGPCSGSPAPCSWVEVNCKVLHLPLRFLQGPGLGPHHVDHGLPPEAEVQGVEVRRVRRPAVLRLPGDDGVSELGVEELQHLRRAVGEASSSWNQ